MPRAISLSFLLTLFFFYNFADAAEVDLDRITALAKTYFRDSAEVPMNVAVTAVVTDGAGNVKHRGQSSVRMVFRGYNQQSGKFSLHADSGWFNTGALYDSMSGDLAAFEAASLLVPRKDSTRHLELRQPAEAGKPILVLVKDTDCPALALIPRFLFPKKPCGSAEFSLTLDAGGDLTFQHFSFASSGSSLAAKVAHLGDVQATAFHADVDFQKGFLPGDPKPFLWPKQTVIALTTNKGTVTVTNQYSPKQSPPSR